MKILGNRILVSRVEEEKKDGFQTVEVQDSFVYKGRVEIGISPQYYGGGEYLGERFYNSGTTSYSSPVKVHDGIKEGDIILFAKNSPDTHEIDIEGKKMKVVMINDIIAIL